MNKLFGTLEKYNKAAEKEVENALDNIPKQERKPFVESLKTQQEQAENMTTRATEEVIKAVDRLS